MTAVLIRIAKNSTSSRSNATDVVASIARTTYYLIFTIVPAVIRLLAMVLCTMSRSAAVALSKGVPSSVWNLSLPMLHKRSNDSQPSVQVAVTRSASSEFLLVA